MAFRSPLVRQALAGVRTLAQEFQLYREHAYRTAETETNGVLLNARGKAAGIDPYSLFHGPAQRAYAYASEELIEHWTIYPRPVFEEFERTRSEVWADPELERLRDIIRRARAALDGTRPVFPPAVDALRILEEL